MKKIFFPGAIFLMAMAVAVLLFAWPSIYPTGTTIYNPGKAFNGYTMFNSGSTMYLMDMNGKVVHTWKLPFSAHHGELKPNGNLVVICADPKAMPGRPGQAPYLMGGGMGWIYELDWESNIVFKHFDPTMHHDFSMMKNGNYLYVGWEQVPKELQKKVRGGERES